MTDSSKKIRTDFLKSLGIIKPCPCDFDFLEPIPDNQLLKSLVNKTVQEGSNVEILSARYGVNYFTLAYIKRGVNKFIKSKKEG